MKNKQPIFILGCQRSGTSMLRRIIDSHSNISCPPESAFFVQFSRVQEIERARAGLETMGFSEREILNQMRKFTEYFFEEYAKRKGKNRWADKSAPYINHIETIDKMFNKEVIYIAIIRHGLDVAYSLVNSNLEVHKSYCDEYNINEETAAIRFWRDQNKKIIDFSEKAKERIYFIKYEDLTSNPEKELKELFSFLNEPWEEEIVNFYKFKHDPGFDDPKIDTYNKIEKNSNNYKKWDITLQRHLWQQSYSVLKKFNYTIQVNK